MKIHQLKTQWYYWFWAVCAVAVVGGQVYVGSGYRYMGQQIESFIQLQQCNTNAERN